MMSQQRLPCCDRDGQDKRSGVATGLALGRDFLSRQSLVKTKSFYVTKIVLCRNKVSQG